MPLLARTALDQPGSIVKFVHVIPPSVLSPPKNWASSLATRLVPLGDTPLSLRESCQLVTIAPVVGSTAIWLRNWLRIGLAGSSLTRIGADQVVPPLSLYRTMTSVSLFSSTVSSR